MKNTYAVKIPSVVHDQSGMQKPRLTLVGEDRVLPKRLNLEVRGISVLEEIAQKKLPQDVKILFNKIADCRYQIFKGKYDLVLYWTQLKSIGGDFWTTLNCNSPEEVLIQIGLPIDITLAKLQVAVNNFTESTFVLLGDEVLTNMLDLGSQYEKDDPNKRTEFYQEVFNHYCNMYDSYDQKSFLEVLSLVAVQKYVKPKSSPPPPPPIVPNNVHTEAEVNHEDEAGDEGSIIDDFVEDIIEKVVNKAEREDIKVDPTNSSKNHEKLAAAVRHVERLEAIIKPKLENDFEAAVRLIEILEKFMVSKFGADTVPNRPMILSK